MNQQITDATNMQLSFLDLFLEQLTLPVILFAIYVLLCAVFICKFSFKGILWSIIAVVSVYIGYLLVYDITYIQYLMSLRIGDSVRLIFSQRLPSFTMAKHAPSKAMPKFNSSHFSLAKIKWDSSFIMKYYYKYSLELQKMLLYYARIYVIILMLPKNKYFIYSTNTRIKQTRKFFKLLKRLHKKYMIKKIH